MTQDTSRVLEELQELNQKIEDARSEIAEIEDELAEVEAPALELEDELSDTEDRLQEVKVDERRMELAADEKQARVKKLEERLNEVKSVRQEAAVRAELDMVKRALETDEQEALALLDQIKRVERQIDELQEKVDEARAEVEPRRNELLERKDSTSERLADLKEERDAMKDGLTDQERQLFESFQAGGRDIVVAPLTPDGACGHCFNMVPIQRRNEIRHGSEMIRCEACGVILSDSASAGSSENGSE